MSKKYKNSCTTLNYIGKLLNLASTLRDVFQFLLLLFCLLFLLGIMSFATGFEICAIAARIKRYNSIIKKKKKKHVIVSTI